MHCAENVHYQSASPEITELCKKMQSTLDTVTNPADHKTSHSIVPNQLLQSNCDRIARSDFVYKLQILYGTNFQALHTTTVFSASSRTNSLDPYIVVYCEGCQLARSAVTPKSTTPLFRSLRNSSSEDNAFCVEIPNRVAFAHLDDAKDSGISIRLYDHDTIGSDTFLGEVRLGSLDLTLATGRRLIKSLQPMRSSVRQWEQNLVGSGEVHVVGHLVSGQPRMIVSIIEACQLTSAKIPRPSSAPLYSTIATKATCAAVASPFVICHTAKNELFRTEIALNNNHPLWRHRAQNTFHFHLSPIATTAYKGCPELHFDFYDTVYMCSEYTVVLSIDRLL